MSSAPAFCPARPPHAAGWRTLRPGVRRAVLCALLAHAAGSAGAQTAAPAARELRVEQVLLGGVAASPLSGADRIVRQTPPEPARTTLTVGEVLPLGTRLAVGESVQVQLKSADGAIAVTLPPRTVFTLASADRVQLDQGRASFALLRKLDFAFGVTLFSRIAAIASGTRFSVQAEARCQLADQPGDAPCALIELEEGRLAIETRPPLRVGEGPDGRCAASGLGAPEPDEADRLLLVEPLAAGQQRVLSLDPERFAVRFDTWAEAEAHFRTVLAQVQGSGDMQAEWRALRNLGVVLRLGERNDAALDLALRGLAQAEALGDRRWQLRFLSDAALARWRARRDLGALPWLDRALAMTDALTAARTDNDTDLDTATLLARRGILRFEARQRSKPGADLDLAEADLRQALKLREAVAGTRAALDASRSHFDLGVLLRIGRKDFAGAAAQLRQALALRSAGGAGCQDLLTAFALTELALAEEELAYAELPAPAASAVPGPRFEAVRQHFDASLAILGRLFPEGDNAAVARVSRRAADFHRELAAQWAGLQRTDEARREADLALQRYHRALAVLDTPSPAWQSERASALLGRGHAWLDASRWAEADRDLHAALAVWQAQRCAGAPDAVSDLSARSALRLLAQAATGAGQPAQAAQWQARQTAADPWLPCNPPP